MVDRRHGRTGLYLVEVRSCPPSADDAVRMHRALARAVTRLGTAGTPIRWCAAWLLPGDGRCLCVVRAARRADVVRALDLAAVSTASVSPARALADSLTHVGSRS
ncbi:hypothetical protein [Geodermatophilus sp. SYSU D00079]